jgi:hypothetical protein
MTTLIYEASVIETQELGSDKVTRQQLVMCCHCGMHFQEPRDGFFFCDRCVGPVCGQQQCVEKCVHLEQWMENMEAGRAPDWKPTRIFVPQNFRIAPRAEKWDERRKALGLG